MNKKKLISKEQGQKLIFLSIVTLFWFAQYVYIPYQATFLGSLRVTSKAIGAVVGAYGISQMALRLPVGLCADRMGFHKPFIMAGTLASGCASLFRIYCLNETGFFLANLFSGLASAMWISFMVFYTGKYAGEDQQKATSRIILFNNLGMLLGFLSSTCFYARIGMKNICALSLIAGISAFILTFFIKEPHQKRETPSVCSLAAVCKGKRILLFSFLALIQQGIQLTTAMSFTNQFLKEAGATDQMVGVASIIYMISAVLFAAGASAKLCIRKGPAILIPATFLVLAAYCVLVPVAPSVPVLLLLQILPGTGTGILFSYVTGEAMKGVGENQKATAMGFFQAVYAVGMTLFPLAAGSMAGSFGMGRAYLALAGIAIGGLAASLAYYFKPVFKTRKIPS